METKFIDGSLTKDDVHIWVVRQSESNILDNEELSHVVGCLYKFFQWYHEGAKLGPFLSAVVKNDFLTTSTSADDINVKVLPLYAKFVHNNISIDFR